MKNLSILFLNFFLGIILIFSSCNTQETKSEAHIVLDPLSSWNEGESKQAILDFVTRTTTEGTPDFIPESDRVAVFDNDGTLWSEQPIYFQLAYAIDFIKKEAPNHPEWSNKEPYKSLLAGDMEQVLAGGEKTLLQLVMASHAGMSGEEFNKSVTSWLETAKHPKTGKPYEQMIFQPMVELLEYLRANSYKTFIVSGGGIDFMRVWAEKAYGIPPYQVIGSSIKAQYEVIDGIPVIIKLPELNFIDDKEGKPVGIHYHIGKRPVFAAGNSDGDYAMLQYTSTGDGPRFGMIVHHTDSVREFAYDRDSPIGNLAKGLDDATKYDWLIIDMQKDWKVIYP